MKKDNITKLVVDIMDEISLINQEPIKPSKKLRKLALLEEKAKARLEKIKSS